MDMNQLWEYLDSEVAATPMPKEYENYIVDILCKDCHKVCFTQKQMKNHSSYAKRKLLKLMSALLFPGIDGEIPRGRFEMHPLWRLQHLPDKD